jgi:hypothetical protein
MFYGVDALLIAWMILMQALWLKLRFKTTTKQLASWYNGFIRWWPGSSARIDRVERRRRTFAR